MSTTANAGLCSKKRDDVEKKYLWEDKERKKRKKNSNIKRNLFFVVCP